MFTESTEKNKNAATNFSPLSLSLVHHRLLFSPKCIEVYADRVHQLALNDSGDDDDQRFSRSPPSLRALYGFMFNDKQGRKQEQEKRVSSRETEIEHGQLFLFDGQSADDKDDAIPFGRIVRSHRHSSLSLPSRLAKQARQSVRFPVHITLVDHLIVIDKSNRGKLQVDVRSEHSQVFHMMCFFTALILTSSLCCIPILHVMMTVNVSQLSSLIFVFLSARSERGQFYGHWCKPGFLRSNIRHLFYLPSLSLLLSACLFNRIPRG